MDILEGKVVEVPIYDFKTNARYIYIVHGHPVCLNIVEYEAPVHTHTHTHTHTNTHTLQGC